MLFSIRRLFQRNSQRTSSRQRLLAGLAPRRFERLEARAMLAGDTFGAIAGVAFNDLSGDGLTADDGFVAQAVVNLYQDVNLNGQLDAADVPLRSIATSAIDGTYRFDGLGRGSYLVEQVAVSGFLQRAGEHVQGVTISTADALGQMGTPIDSFVTSQSVAASSAAAGSRTAASSVLASEAIGGERDVEAELTSPFGEVELNINPFGQPLLEIASSSSAIGRRLVTWDGADGDGDSLAAEGLNHVDLTSSGNVSGFVISIGADHPDGIATFRVYTDAANWSERMVSIPEQVESVTVFFSEFTVGEGVGASFTDVGAIQLEIAVGAAVDGQIDVITTIGPTVLRADFANYEPVSVGNQVWSDANNDGVYDASSEGVLANVVLNLFADTNGDQKLTPGSDSSLGSTTTDANGRYLFGNLFPGSYIVQVAQSNFAAAGTLARFVTSSGNEPTLDPDAGNVDNDDNGDGLAGQGVVASAVTLTAHGEPTNDGDDDANSNLTVDFGFEALIPDVSITKTDHLATVTAGQQLTYEIVVSSVGNTVAQQVVVDDVLPVDLVTLVSTSDAANVTYDANSGLLRWSAGDIGSGDARSLMVTVRTVDPVPAAAETLTNTATVSHADPDPTPEDNTATDLDEVAASPDYAIAKDDGLGEVEPGDTVTYEIVVSNVGNQNGTGVVVTDQYPANVLSVISTIPQTTIDEVTGTIVWDLGDLDAGDSRRITLQARVLPGVDRSIVEFTNSVRVTDDLANGADPTPANNVAADTDQIIYIPDVSITKTDHLATITAGQQLTYEIVVSSVGNTVAQQVVVEDVLSVDLVTLVSTSDAANVTYDASSGQLLWSAGDIAAGDARVLMVTVAAVDPVPAAAETLTNTVTVSHADPDPTPEDNISSDIDEVAASPDYTITKDDGLDAVKPGDTVNYEIVVSNVGHQDGTGVVVTDQYPADVLSIISTVPLTTIDPTSGTIVWDLGNLDAGDSRSITLRARVLPGVDPSIVEFTNSVRVTDDLANGADPTPANNVAADTDQIIYIPDVSITKTNHLTTITAGQQLTYEIVVNSIGLATAEHVTVNDVLPVDLLSLNSTSDDANVVFDAQSGQLIWSAGDIARGSSKTLRVTVTAVNPVPAGRDNVVNSVSVTHDGDDPTPENNSASDVDVLIAAPDYQISKSDRLTNVIPGQLITYQMQVTNVGDQNGTGVRVTDTFPLEALVGVSAGPNGRIDQASGIVVWDLGDLAVGETRNVTFEARVASNIDLAVADFTNVARVTDDGANGPDPTPQSNVARDTDLVDLVLSQVSGFVYADFNNNGLLDSSDLPIPGVPIRLVGTDVRGNAVDRLTQTGVNGQYVFEELAPGLYDILETQPASYNDGQDTAGTVRAKAGGLSPQSLPNLQILDDQFARLELGAGVDASEFNFGELAIMRSKRDHLGWRF